MRSLLHLASLAASLALCALPVPPAADAATADAAIADAAIAATADAAATSADSPIGVWKTFDDKTGAARAIVRIYLQDGLLFGKIEGSFTPGVEKRVCQVCSDERKNQPMLGLVIIRNMKHTDDEYSGGDILDPDTGKVYHCKMHVEDGTRLVVRGYIGFSLLGRNQTWQRLPESTSF
jgi:uncharacterized protein (DUF2147 family)